MIDDILKDAKIRMGKTAESLENELSRMRTGRAHPSLLESVKVDYYGAESPLSQVANVNIEDARMLTVTPWDGSRGREGHHQLEPRSESQYGRYGHSGSGATDD